MHAEILDRISKSDARMEKYFHEQFAVFSASVYLQHFKSPKDYDLWAFCVTAHLPKPYTLLETKKAI